jgi:GH43 family beta-xylosidase
VFFTCSTSSNVWNIRPRVIACNLGAKDPLNPDCWEKTGHLLQAAVGDNTSFTTFSLDMTTFDNKGKQYVVWAQIMGNSSLAIATVDGQQPWLATSKYTLLSSPEYAWENDNVWVDEGPAVIKNNGKIYVAFSASAVNTTYCVGVMYADENSDLLDPKSWTKVRYPLLTTSDLPVTQLGPGHNSFSTDQYGNPVIVYHARDPKEVTTSDLYDPGRHAFVKSLNFGLDGAPVLNMTREQELAPVNKNVTVEVVVE